MTVGSCSKCPPCQRGLSEQGVGVIYTSTKKVLSKDIVFFVCVPPYPERETVHLQQLLVFFYILLRLDVWPLFVVISKSVHAFFQLQRPFSTKALFQCMNGCLRKQIEKELEALLTMRLFAQNMATFCFG